MTNPNEDMVVSKSKDYDKELNNTMYLEKIEKGFAQVESGHGTKHDLIEVDD